jgi:Glycosyltransferase family 10 (fucosyltransferase) C-term
MNIKVAAFSADVLVLKNNQLFEGDIAALYPGSSFASYVKKLCHSDVVFYTADVALDLVKRHQLNPQCVAVIQHNQDPECVELIELGALPLLLTMYESPLYAGKFYDNFFVSSSKFHNVMVFGGDSLNIQGARQAYFPCFSEDDLLCATPVIEWGKRRFASMVMGNKYVLTKPLSFASDYRDALWWLAKLFRNFMSNFELSKTINVEKFQLQDKRLEIAHVMLEKNILDLYGIGWDKLYRIPPKMKEKLSVLLPKKGVDIIPYGKNQKNKYLAKYKFNICFENMAYPGYVTEKIIDSILGRTIPVYLGAPDILNYVPADVFIDATQFHTIKDLVAYLLMLDEGQANLIIESGQRFLSSPAGLKFSYQSIAKEINSLFLPYIQPNLSLGVSQDY